MSRYLLSRKADEDLDEIADYSLEKWGEALTKKYLVELIDCLEKIAKMPDIGRDASEFLPNLRRFNYKSHSIFFMTTDTEILIVRILGKKQDFNHHL